MLMKIALRWALAIATRAGSETNVSSRARHDRAETGGPQQYLQPPRRVQCHHFLRQPLPGDAAAIDAAMAGIDDHGGKAERPLDGASQQPERQGQGAGIHRHGEFQETAFPAGAGAVQKMVPFLFPLACRSSSMERWARSNMQTTDHCRPGIPAGLSESLGPASAAWTGCGMTSMPPAIATLPSDVFVR